MLISYWTYIHLCLVINNQRHYKYIFLLLLTVWSFCFLYFFICFLMRRKSVINTFLSSLSHEFEQFGSLHVCTKERWPEKCPLMTARSVG